MDNSLWVKMQGGTTHFPIALLMASVLFDLVGLLAPENAHKSRRSGFRAAGFYTLILGALGALGAVLPGLVISHGQLWGRGNLARHHAFLGLAISRVTAALMSAAGYWGGELLLNG